MVIGTPLVVVASATVVDSQQPAIKHSSIQRTIAESTPGLLQLPRHSIAHRMTGTGLRRHSMPVQPGLQHQHVPQVIVPAPLPAHMLLPHLPNRTRRQDTVLTQALFIQERLGPVARPLFNGHAKARLKRS